MVTPTNPSVENVLTEPDAQDLALLKTKLYVPPIRPGLVSRPRLTEQLSAGLHRKLTLVSAPAGFGKTTLLSEWVHQTGIRVAWLSLDEEDNDLVRFLAYVIAALQTIPSLGEAEIGRAALTLFQSAQPPPVESILTSLINDVTEIPPNSTNRPFVLVLDDYHLIETQQIDNALTFLLERLPPLPRGMHLVIASRTDPSLPTSRLRAGGQMNEIRVNDLRFAFREVTQFFNQSMGLSLSPEDIAALETRTEGWIAGLQLAALSMQAEHPDHIPGFIQAFTGSHRYVIDYLTDEVLQQRPKGTKDFLLQTSILDRLSGPLCDAVRFGIAERPSSTKDDRGQEILEALEAANLFIVPLDQKRRWYRYHHLFADLLRQRLHQTQPDRVAALHRRAAEWYEANGFVPEAVSHALEAKDFGGAARLIEQSARRMFARSELATILKWVDALPEDQVRARPSLCIFHAWALRLTGGEFDAVEARLDDAERALEKRESHLLRTDRVEDPTMPDNETREMMGHIAAIRAYQALYREDITRAAELAQSAVERLPEESFVRATSALALGWAHRFSGNLDGASQAFADAKMASLASGNIYVATTALCRSCHGQVLGGRLRQALESCQEALQMATGKDGRPMPVAGYAHVCIGGIYREWNNLEAATHHLLEGINLCSQVGYVVDQVIGYVTLARTKQAQRDLEGATEDLETAKRLSRKMANYLYLRRWVEDCQVRTWLAQGNLAAAARWAQECGLSVDDVIDFRRELEHIILARAFVALGSEPGGEEQLHSALRLLSRLLEVAETAGWMGKAIEILALQALALQAQGEIDGAMTVLERALSLGEPEGFLRIFVDEGRPMGALLGQAAALGVAADYVRRLLNTFEPDMIPGITVSASLFSGAPDGVPADLLSRRELQVLQLIAAGLTNREIAQELTIAVSTVKTHVKNIHAKLVVRNRTQAAARAREMHLLS